MQRQDHPLLSPSLTTQRSISSFHFGTPGSGQKVYIQASLHADELPGMMTAWHLKQKLAALEAEGRLAGEIILVPVANPTWWQEFFFEIRWYLFLERYPKKYIGHNPVGQIAMASFIWATLFMCATGFALYGEGTGAGSWAHSAFGWVIVAFGNSLDVHSWHRLGMWAILLFVMIHVYAAIREDIMSKQSMVSTMISGFRMFKD